MNSARPTRRNGVLARGLRFGSPVRRMDDCMANRDDVRVVYSTGAGSICPECGKPFDHCHGRHQAIDEAVPARVVAKLRMERTGRGGKTVTVIDGLPRNAAFLKQLCQDLKRAAGCGGAVQDGAVELQGDLRERVREILVRRGFAVKG
jgi:translation initiation factor 1